MVLPERVPSKVCPKYSLPETVQLQLLAIVGKVISLNDHDLFFRFFSRSFSLNCSVSWVKF